MRIPGFVAVAFLVFTVSLAQAQSPPAGGFVPGQHREPGDPVQVARGKALYGIHCGICHGPDLRGGDMGGPNLLRSQVALSDQHGELIVPIIQGSRAQSGMPAIPISPQDSEAVAAYVRSVLEMIGEQGTPPSTGQAPPNVLVGNAKEGQAYFAAKCSSCHSPEDDLRGIATRITDAKQLQSAWVRGEWREGHRGMANAEADTRRVPRVSIVPASGQRIEGRLIHIDDFLVTAQLADGSIRSFRRHGDDPKIEIHDPMKAHRDLLTQYTDRDIHDVTAFLATLK